MGFWAFSARLFALCFVIFVTGDAQAKNLNCLWSKLATADRARLELDARIGAKPLQTLFARHGEVWFSQFLKHCDIALTPASVLLVGHYLGARAGAEVEQARLLASGLKLDALNAALNAEAPPNNRKALAEEILQFNRSVRVTGAAVRAVRSIAKRLEKSARDQRAAHIAQNWAAHRILVDGLEAGAQPPKR